MNYNNTRFSAGQWYIQKFSDQHLYFFVQDFTKQGKARGILVRELLGSRAFPKSVKDTATTPQLWTPVASEQVPPRVRESFLEKVSG